MKFLDFSTNHGEEITVDNLAKMKLEIVEEKLDEKGLEVFLLDTDTSYGVEYFIND